MYECISTISWRISKQVLLCSRYLHGYRYLVGKYILTGPGTCNISRDLGTYIYTRRARLLMHSQAGGQTGPWRVPRMQRTLAYTNRRRSNPVCHDSVRACWVSPNMYCERGTEAGTESYGATEGKYAWQLRQPSPYQRHAGHLPWGLLVPNDCRHRTRQRFFFCASCRSAFPFRPVSRFDLSDTLCYVKSFDEFAPEIPADRGELT